MSLLAQVFRPQAGSVSSSPELLRELRGPAFLSESGAIVSPDAAMRLATVYACVKVLAETVAQVPLNVFRRKGEDRELAADHWLYPLLHDTPNTWQTSFEWREMMQAHLALAGNAYSLITQVRGEVRELLPLIPDRVLVLQDPTWKFRYLVTLPFGQQLEVPPDRILHLRGMSLNGVTGLSPVGYQREAIGIGIQLTRFQAKIFTNGTRLSGVIEHPGALTKQAADRLKDQFEEQYAGVGNAHKTLLLEEGSKYTTTGMSNADAQFLESRQLSATEICSIFRVPPHMIGHLERSTNNNIEQQALEFVMYTMQPWFERWEDRLGMSLVPQGSLFVEFMVDGLLRGDFKTRMDGYQKAVLTGWLSRNEVRRREGYNAGPPELDEYMAPINEQLAQLLGAQPKTPAAGEGAAA